MRKHQNFIRTLLTIGIAVLVCYYLINHPGTLSRLWDHWGELYGWCAFIFTVVAFLYGIPYILTWNAVIYIFLWTTHRNWDVPLENKSYLLMSAFILVIALCFDLMFKWLEEVKHKRTHRQRGDR